MPCTLDQSYLATSVWKPGIFAGKVVFVTGGAGSICRVQVEALVLLGANAAIIGRRQLITGKVAQEIQQLRSGAKVLGFGCDVRKVEELKSAVDKTVAEFGKIDFVIAGAAGNFISDFNHLSANAFKTVIDIDLIGSYNTAKATFQQLKKNKGHIVFISATLHYSGLPLQVHASAAKAGVDSLARTLAVELGPLGIRSNVIAPGPIAGTVGMEKLAPPDTSSSSSSSTMGGNYDYVKSIPSQRLGTTQDIADATVFLLSSAATYINGETIVVDGAAWQSIQPVNLPTVYPSMLVQLNSEQVTKL